MGILYSIGKTLVTPDELEEKTAMGDLRTMAENVSDGSDRMVGFSTGNVSTAAVRDEIDALPFQPVGLNKPMSIEILTAYTGNAPSRSFFDRIIGRNEPDLLIVSGAKTSTTFNAAPRAINQIVEKIEDKKFYKPSAFSDGSPIIYHSPGVVDASFFVSVEMVADSFTGDVFTHLGSLFQAAAGLPIFAPAAAYLLAGSQLTQMASKLAEAFTETPPFLRSNEDIRLDSAGIPVELSRLVVFASDSHFKELSKYDTRVVEEVGSYRATLVDKQSGKEYDGDIPYIIASLDGRPRPEYKDYTPQHASAALLDRFYGKNTASAVTDVVKDALTLYNDFKYRQKADQTRKLLSNLPQDSDEYKKADAKLQALLANIQTELLKNS